MCVGQRIAVGHHVPLTPVGTGCGAAGLEANVLCCSCLLFFFAFLVNVVVIGENICQHTLTEHNCSI